MDELLSQKLSQNLKKRMIYM